MSTIEEILRKNRPKITESSIKTYATTLRGIYRKAFPSDDEIDFSKFNDVETFLAVLKDTPSARRKSVLAALVVFTENDRYRPLMKSDSELYENEINENKKSSTQKENWVTQDEIKNTLNKLERMALGIWKLPQLKIFAKQDILFLFIVSRLRGDPHSFLTILQ
jgi:hypothetical protein